MSLFQKIIATALAGAALGLAATYVSVSRGFTIERTIAGPWRGMPQVANTGADPYARAMISRSAQAPLGFAEGLAFVASTDSKGARLSTHCAYRIAGPLPGARFWTLTAMSPEGLLIPTRSMRFGYTSSEILRDAQGRFAIVAATSAQPGNWLELAPERDFILVLKIYDSPHSTSATVIRAGDLPEISAEACA